MTDKVRPEIAEILEPLCSQIAAFYFGAGEVKSGYVGLDPYVVGLLVEAANKIWEEAYQEGRGQGYQEAYLEYAEQYKEFAEHLREEHKEEMGLIDGVKEERNRE